MRKSPPNIHLEIQRRGERYFGVIRSSFREDGKVKHTNHGRIPGLDLDRLKLIQAAFRDDVVVKGTRKSLEILNSREHGASAALVKLAKDIGLDETIHAMNPRWTRYCLAMIVGRVIFQGSKLALSNVGEDSCLWENVGLKGEIDVNRCYEAMDKLLDRQKTIQKTLAKKHLNDGCLVLYDITSTYFEGEYEDSGLIKFGYSRDKKRGRKQVVIGLIANEKGCPIGLEVFEGNTQDASTVAGKIKEVREEYGVEDIIFVGDRGMITKTNYDTFQENLLMISALTRPQIQELLEEKTIQLSYFDTEETVEIIDPNDPKRRYCLCKNPDLEAEKKRSRLERLEKTRLALEKIELKKGKPELIGAKLERVFEKYKTRKYFYWAISDKEDGKARLSWRQENDIVAEDASIDGCYIIHTNVPAEQMDKREVVANYKKLQFVETAFRNMKTVRLELRPVFHRTDERIRSHIFLCMLAYYLQWHMQQRLKPWMEEAGEGRKRNRSLAGAIRRLESIRKNRVSLNGVEFSENTRPDKEQREILDLMKTKL